MMREVGGLVGRRAIVRLGVSRNSPKKKLGSGVRGKKVIKKLFPETNKLSQKI
jgi:hypothetical protein